MLVGLSVEVLARLALVLLLAARLIERIPKFSAVSSILHTCVILLRPYPSRNMCVVVGAGQGFA